MKKEDEIIVHLARLGLSGRPQDVQSFLRRIVRGLDVRNTELADTLGNLLAAGPSRTNPLRDAGAAMLPIDGESRLSLLRQEHPVVLSEPPILPPALQERLDQVIAERRNLASLSRLGLAPARSLLFVGPPGVGKTLSARWIAEQLGRPLFVLELSTVMSSYLGKTGANLRNVLDYAKSVESVLLLDEFDAVAKRRDDDGEIGELKRLVTVLLQEIDDWPDTSLLIAATNHGNLLDPAAWRRFDDVLQFDFPAEDLRARLIGRAFGPDAAALGDWAPVLARLWAGRSFSEIVRTIQWIRRRCAVQSTSVQEALLAVLSGESERSSLSERRVLAQRLLDTGLSDRKISDITGMSRDTLRRMRRNAEDKSATAEN